MLVELTKLKNLILICKVLIFILFFIFIIEIILNYLLIIYYNMILFNIINNAYSFEKNKL